VSGCFIVFLFGIFRLNAREFTVVTLYTLAAYAVVINLLMRYYDPTKGSIRIDGRDLRDYDLQSLRRRMGLVLQDGVRVVVSTAVATGDGGTSDERGQTTAEYALVILAAAAIAIVLIAWARSSGKLPAFFDHIIDQLTNSAS
jgi:ABC-type transport system involved in Fe-S cluster assembly fused permease/ATPase subunit